MSVNVDPELGSLLEVEESPTNPDYNALFGDSTAGPAEAADSTREHFAPIAIFKQDSQPYFKDKDYYKKVLFSAGEEISKRFHSLLTNFLNAQDPQDRSMHRGRLIPAYWDLVDKMLGKTGGKLTLQQRLLLRFGVVSPTFIDARQRDMLSTVVFENKTSEPVYYVDEWIGLVANGTVKPSETDEVKIVRKDANQRKLDIIEKRRGQLEAEMALLQKHLANVDGLESQLAQNVKTVLHHGTRPDYNDAKDAFSPEQKKALSELNDLIRRLQSGDKEVAAAYRRLGNLREEIEGLSDEVGGADAMFVDSGAVQAEFQTIRQMSKLSVGRQGNHFPILMKNYLRTNINDVSTRENVVHQLTQIEKMDPGLFHRSFKGQTNRIVPYIILVPCYGEVGVCWEPFSRQNRASSRGRVAVPLYPKKVDEAVIAAVADLRWQVAKEKAQHHWMEEGLTGRYYQWFSDQRMKGNIKDAFIRDYILWITAESQGMQKLDREVRGIFWRQMPFPQEIKDNLRNRGFVYNDLYKKDINISRSDGY